MKRFNVFLGLSCLAVMQGCSQTDSDNVRTSGIKADFNIEANGDGSTEVMAYLEVGSGGFGATEVELSSGDNLVATAFGNARTLSKRSDFFGLHYETSFDADEGGSTFTLALNRVEGESAVNSFVVLPQPFTLTNPAVEQVFTRNQTVELEWQALEYGDTVLFEWSVDCSYDNASGDRQTIVNFDKSNISDDGSHTTTVSAWLADIDAQLPAMGDCDAEVSLSRTQEGVLDQGFGEGGSINAKQTRSRKIIIRL